MAMNDKKRNIINHDTASGVFCIVFLILLGIFSFKNSSIQGPVVLENIKNAFGRSKSFLEFKNYILDFEKHMGETLLGKYYFIGAYAYIQRVLGKEETDNFWVVRDRKGRLNYANFYPDDVTNVEECARRIRRMKESVADKGTRVFFVNPPALYVRNKQQYSPGLPYGDHNFLQDSFLYQLRRYGIDYIDLRDSLARHDGLEYFYLTDHHWTIETSFAAFTDMVSWMERTYQTDVDRGGYYRDINNYMLKQYPQSSLGSMGRATGANFSGFDDFTVIWPKFDVNTDFTYEGHFMETYRPEPKRGTYTRALLAPEFLRTDDPYMVDLYAFYQGGIKSSDKIVNHKNPEGPRILLIRDSFFLPVAVFMAPLFSEIHMFWPSTGEMTFDGEIYNDVEAPYNAAPAYNEASANKVSYNIEAYLKDNIFDYIIIEMYQENLKLESFSFFPNEPGKD